MNLLAETVLKGCAIGVITSAPLGPMGVFCIQQTLSYGRKTGFAASVGVALSDLTYALLTGLCLTFVSDFIDTHTQLLQIIGSLVLLGFGYYLYKQNPTQNFTKQGMPKSNYLQKTVAAYLLTLSNPFVIFLFVSLFAQLHLFAPDSDVSYIAVGYSSIFIGSICWWFTIVYLISKMSARFNIRNLRIVNQVFGFVIVAMSIIGFLLGVIKV